MGLNPRGRGRGGKGRRGGGMGGQGPPFRGGPPGMFGPPPMGFPPGPPFGGPPFFGGPSGSNFGPRRHFGKFPRKNFKKNQQKSNETPVPEIDLTKPWVTEAIKTEDTKKQELLETWRKSKDDGDWKKYKEQKQAVQKLYDQAKQEYIASHPEEAVYLLQSATKRRIYLCEPCDKTFKTDDCLILHEAEHEICGREGCQYTAHPKIVAKHIRVQHDSGLYKRIGKLQSEEDIAKWIEERKRRYPTRQAIEEKKTIEEEKEKRGERINPDESKFNKSFIKKNNKTGNKSKFKNRSFVKKTSRERKKTATVKKVQKEEKLDESCKVRDGVPAFQGIGALSEPEPEPPKSEEIPDQFTDDEWEATGNEDANDYEPIVNKSLRLLASCYASDTDDGEDGEKEKTDSKTSPQTKEDSDNDSSPEEVKTIVSKDIQSEKTLEPSENVKTNKRKRSRRKSENCKSTKLKCDNEKNNKFNNNVRQRSLTLLEKLLSNEIRHERNVILQCVRYVVQNNFFQSS